MAKNQQTDPFFSFAKREDADIQLATGALLIAQTEYLALKIEDYLCQLDEMANTVREQIQGTTLPENHIAELNRYLFQVSRTYNTFINYSRG